MTAMLAPEMDLVSEMEFMALGMHLIGSPNWKRRKEDTNVEAFVTHFGASPKVCATIWLDLQTTAEASICIGAKDSPLYLLLGLRYLKAYPKDAELCGFFCISSKRTMTKWRDVYIAKMAKLLENKVSKSF